MGKSKLCKTSVVAFLRSNRFGEVPVCLIEKDIIETDTTVGSMFTEEGESSSVGAEKTVSNLYFWQDTNASNAVDTNIIFFI